MSILVDPFFLHFAGLSAAAAAAAITSSWALRNAFGPRSAAGLRETLAAWLPLALVALILASRTPSIALTLIYSSSVTAITLMLGGALYFTARPPGSSSSDEIKEPSALSVMLLPMAIMLWVIGFSGRLDWQHALVLAIAGLAISGAVWPRPAKPAANKGFRVRMVAGLEGLLGIAAGVGAAIASVYLGEFARSTGGRLPPELMAVTPLAPLLGIPLYASVAHLAKSRRHEEAASVACGYAVLNIAFLLPGLLVLSMLSHLYSAAAEAGAAATENVTAISDVLLGIPLILWRVENVILLIAVLALAGIKMGYYRAGRALGAGLLFLYIVYLFCSVTLRLG